MQLFSFFTEKEETEKVKLNKEKIQLASNSSDSEIKSTKVPNLNSSEYSFKFIN